MKVTIAFDTYKFKKSHFIVIFASSEAFLARYRRPIAHTLLDVLKFYKLYSKPKQEKLLLQPSDVFSEFNPFEC